MNFNMKKLLLVLFLCPVVLLAQKKGFTIAGKLDGYPDNTEVKLFENNAQTPLATAKIVKSKFIMKGSVAEPVLCMLIIGDEAMANTGRPAEVYIENAAISIKGNKNMPGTIKVDGSASHKDFAAFVATFMPVAQKLNTIASTINYTMPGAARDSMMNVYSGLQQQMQDVIDKMVTEKPSSVVTPFLLNATYSFNEDVVKLENRYDKLAATIKSSKTGVQLKDFITEKKIGAIGTEAMDFSQPDTTGTPVSLSSFRGQYVLVDFWASWCGPCRNENPTVVENFNSFKTKNFTVLGVSLDRPGKKNDWINAIKEDGLTWTHVSDLQFWNNAVAKMYNIQGIPQNILVDPSGKIVAKNLRGPALRDKLCELLGCN
jgi:peroxiredoxin